MKIINNSMNNKVNTVKPLYNHAIGKTKVRDYKEV